MNILLYNYLNKGLHSDNYGVIFLPGEIKQNKAMASAVSMSFNVEGANTKKNRIRNKESTKRQAMLNTRRINPFKYDMHRILEVSKMDQYKASSFLASVIARASRVSTRNAKEFVKTFLESYDITKEEHDKMCRLLDRYSKFR